MLQQILRIDGHIQNIYLAVYPNKILLLDGCCRADVPLILDTIKHTLGRDITELKTVVVTHIHADHAGGAQYLKQKTGCVIASALKPKQWYAGLSGRVMYTIDTSLAYFVAHRQGKSHKNLWYPRELVPDVAVKEGDTVPFFDDWQFIETAGHTDRDLSVYHAKTGKVYVADVIIKLTKRFVYPFPLYSPKEYKRSLIKISELNPKLVMLAHGGQIPISPKTFVKLIKNSPRHRRTVKDAILHKLFGRSVPYF